MLRHAGNAEGVVSGAHGNDQAIVPQGKFPAVQRGAALDGFLRGVDIGGLGQVKPDIRPGGAHGLDDAAEFDGPRGGAGEQRGKEKVVPGADDGTLVALDVDVANQAEGAEAGAQYHEAGMEIIRPHGGPPRGPPAARFLPVFSCKMRANRFL